jgi:hypothetical protein
MRKIIYVHYIFSGKKQIFINFLVVWFNRIFAKNAVRISF